MDNEEFNNYEKSDVPHELGAAFFEFMENQPEEERNILYTTLIEYFEENIIEGDNYRQKIQFQKSVKGDPLKHYTHYLRSIIGDYLIQTADPRIRENFDLQNERMMTLLFQFLWRKLQVTIPKGRKNKQEQGKSRFKINAIRFVRDIFESHTREFNELKKGWEFMRAQTDPREIFKAQKRAGTQVHQILSTSIEPQRQLPYAITAKIYAEREALRTKSTLRTALALPNTMGQTTNPFDELLVMRRLEKLLASITGMHRITSSPEALTRRQNHREIHGKFSYDPVKDSVYSEHETKRNPSFRNPEFDDLCLDLAMGMIQHGQMAYTLDEKTGTAEINEPDLSQPLPRLSLKEFIELTQDINKALPPTETTDPTKTRQTLLIQDETAECMENLEDWLALNNPQSPLRDILKPYHTPQVLIGEKTPNGYKLIIGFDSKGAPRLFDADRNAKTEALTYIRITFEKDNDDNEHVTADVLEEIIETKGILKRFFVLPQAQYKCTKKPDGMIVTSDTEHPIMSKLMNEFKRRLAASKRWEAFCRTEDLSEKEQEIFLRYTTYSYLKNQAILNPEGSFQDFKKIMHRFALRDLYDEDLGKTLREITGEKPESTEANKEGQPTQPTTLSTPRITFSSEFPAQPIPQIISWERQRPLQGGNWKRQLPSTLPKKTKGSPLELSYAHILRPSGTTIEETRTKIMGATADEIRQEINYLRGLKSEKLNETLRIEYGQAAIRELLALTNHSKPFNRFKRLEQLATMGSNKLLLIINKDKSLQRELEEAVQSDLQEGARMLEERCKGFIASPSNKPEAQRRMKSEDFQTMANYYELAKQLRFNVRAEWFDNLYTQLTQAHNIEPQRARWPLNYITSIYLRDATGSDYPFLMGGLTEDETKRHILKMKKEAGELGFPVSSSGYYIPSIAVKLLASVKKGETYPEALQKANTDHTQNGITRITKYGDTMPPPSLVRALLEIGIPNIKRHLSSKKETTPASCRAFLAAITIRLAKEIARLKKETTDFVAMTTDTWTLTGIGKVLKLYLIAKELGAEINFTKCFAEIQANLLILQRRGEKTSIHLAKFEITKLSETTLEEDLGTIELAAQTSQERDTLQKYRSTTISFQRTIEDIRKPRELIEGNALFENIISVGKWGQRVEALREMTEHNRVFPEYSSEFFEEWINKLETVEFTKTLTEGKLVKMFKERPAEITRHLGRLGDDTPQYIYAIAAQGLLRSRGPVRNFFLKIWSTHETKYSFKILSALGIVDHIRINEFGEPPPSGHELFGDFPEAWLKARPQDHANIMKELTRRTINKNNNIKGTKIMRFEKGFMKTYLSQVAA